MKLSSIVDVFPVYLHQLGLHNLINVESRKYLPFFSEHRAPSKSFSRHFFMTNYSLLEAQTVLLNFIFCIQIT